MRIMTMVTVEEIEAKNKTVVDDFAMGRALEDCKDREQAREFYEKVAFYGEPAGKNNLAVMIYEGHDGHVSAAALMPVFELLQEIAEAGYGAGCYNLSYLYERLGDDLDPEWEKKSNYWFARSKVLGFRAS
jgi:TPR repeat protein